MAALEEIVRGNHVKRSLYERATDYLVDVSSAWTFYNPIMAGVEYAGGMEPEEIFWSRLAASALHAVLTRPIGKLRNYGAKIFDITKNSPLYEKIALDVASILTIQIPTHSAALYASGATLDESTSALAIGAATTTLVGRYFGKWQDYWRQLWGKQPAIR